MSRAARRVVAPQANKRHAVASGRSAKLKASLQTARAMVQSMYERGLRPGDHYMSEAEGIAAHSVSRGTYREALRFLEMQGVIVMRAGPAGGVETDRVDDGTPR